MSQDLRCGGCQSVIGAANIDRQRELASCSACGRLTDLRRASGSIEDKPSGKARARAPVQPPTGMSVTMGPQLVITRRWMRAKHWVLLLLFAPAGLYVAYLWRTVGASPWLVIGTIFVVNWYYMLLVMFVNRTAVTADGDGVQVKHGPLPSIFARKAAVKKSEIEQLYAAAFGPQFRVYAKLKSGKILSLVAPLVTEEQALFVEQELERRLGLTDFAVEGELNAGTLEGKRPAGATAGSLLALLIPVLIAGVLGLFFLITRSEVSGRLQAAGALGSWVFEPDGCISGQREGFGGVVLTASAHPERLVRVVRDPVRGNLVVAVSPGRPNQVLNAEACPIFLVNVERTDTSINEIWAMDGSIMLDCKELTGSVKFEGCH